MTHCQELQPNETRHRKTPEQKHMGEIYKSKYGDTEPIRGSLLARNVSEQIPCNLFHQTERLGNV